MKALMTQPMQAESLRVEEIGEPRLADGSLLVSAVALGICGTDRDIIGGEYGSSPPGHERLILGHESLGLVREAPPDSGFAAGDLIVPFVRMPDPVPCDCCAAGEWDRCRNGQFTEHGIKSLDGFGRERYRLAPGRAISIDRSLGILGVLTEPAGVVAKAWAEIDRLTNGVCWTPRRVLITGAGPVGLLAMMIGLQRNLDVHVYDSATEGITPALARDAGATYHVPPFDDVPRDFDIIIECTGAAPIATVAAAHTKSDGIVCLLGVVGHHTPVTVDGAAFNDTLVLGNRVVFGSVNANRRHFELARDALLAADRAWLARLITRRVPFDRWADAFRKGPDDIKTVIVFDVAESID